MIIQYICTAYKNMYCHTSTAFYVIPYQYSILCSLKIRNMNNVPAQHLACRLQSNKVVVWNIQWFTWGKNKVHVCHTAQ